MNRTTVLAISLLLLAGSAWAQATLPTPGAEVKKLEYFVGTWTTDGTIAQGPWGAGGKFSSSETAEWMPGRFFVMTHGDFKMPPELGGDGRETSIMGYDTDQNRYTSDAYNSQGKRESSKGTLIGDTWTWTSTANYGGQEISQKFTLKVLSPTSYSLKVDVSVDGTNWLPFMEGKASKK